MYCYFLPKSALHYNHNPIPTPGSISATTTTATGIPAATTTATTTTNTTANTTRTTARYWLYSRTCGRPDIPQDSNGCRGLGKGGGQARWGACRPRGNGGGRHGGGGRGIDGGRHLALTGTNEAPGTPGTMKARARAPRWARPVCPWPPLTGSTSRQPRGRRTAAPGTSRGSLAAPRIIIKIAIIKLIAI